MKIKYPKTELMVVLGSKVYPLYVTETQEEIQAILNCSNREDMLTFEAAIRRHHGKGLWYPECGDEPHWTGWTTKKSTIKSYIELPEPKVNIDYGYSSDEF